MQSLLEDYANGEYDEEKCISFLEERGYIVISPRALEPSSVKTTQDLVNMFYALLQYHHQDRVVHYAKATTKDLVAARNLVASRKKVCGERKRALQESALIVKTIIENESTFFREPLKSFSDIGTDTRKWVIDKAIAVINTENIKVEEQRFEFLISSLAGQQEQEAYLLLPERVEEFKKFLGEKDGKKDE